VVVVVNGSGASVVVVVNGSVLAVVGGTVVVVVAGGTVVVVIGARYALRCEVNLAPPPREGEESSRSWVLGVAIAVVVARAVCAVPSCSTRRGRPSSAPQNTAATPRRLPLVLCFRRAPPFSGVSAAAPTQSRRGGLLRL
jgi:hypothetical protein